MAQWELVAHVIEWLWRKVIVHGSTICNEEVRLAKETIRELLGHVGIWAATKPLADLAVFLEGAEIALARPGENLLPIPYSSLRPSDRPLPLLKMKILKDEASPNILFRKVEATLSVIEEWKHIEKISQWKWMSCSKTCLWRSLIYPKCSDRTSW